jgi:hypothetical protein
MKVLKCYEKATHIQQKKNDILTKDVNAPNVISVVAGLWKWVYVQIRSMRLGKSFCQYLQFVSFPWWYFVF